MLDYYFRLAFVSLRRHWTLTVLPREALRWIPVFLLLATAVAHPSWYPTAVGLAITHGCIRMYPEDVARPRRELRTGRG
jgi:hypothetical protein